MQLCHIAQQIVSTCGTQNVIFRAGIWKPRTSPDTFQGVGDVGLAWLQQVKRLTGLPVATEISTPEQVQKALEAGIDYLWLGARTSANPILVQALADAMAKGEHKGVLVKNPVNDDADLWMGNIQRLSANHQPVIAIHRGCNHQPCWEMAYRLRQTMPQIPLLLDPSHMSGKADLVSRRCQDAAELQYDGLMIEVHDNPKQALSDAKQQITPDELKTIIRHWEKEQAANMQPTDCQLLWLRRMMDEVDDALWDTIARRMEVSRKIGAFKKEHNIDIVQPTRFEQILSNRLSWAEEKALSEEMVQQIMQALHKESIRVQQ